MNSWTVGFAGWHYYPEPVVTAELEPACGFSMVDGPNVFRHGDRWHMLYFGFDGRGYQSCLATSVDLIHWQPGGLVLGYGEPGAFDYGGVVLVGPLLDTNEINATPSLKKWKGRFWCLYGCYPEQGGYELGRGGQGLAWSNDGIVWHRYSTSRAVLSTEGGDLWEARVVYSPHVVVNENRFWNFYNAKGEAGTEQIGVATSGDLFEWKRNDANPIVRNRRGMHDELLAADPKVYRDGDHWIMFYFGASRNNPDGCFHAHVLAAGSRDLVNWTPRTDPLYAAGGHPEGLDETHAHNVSIVSDPSTGVRFLFYCSVGTRGRCISLLTDRPLQG